MNKKINVLHCFNEYLPLTQNWAYRLIKNTPEVNVFIAARNFLKYNFYDRSFNYLEFPFKKIDFINKDQNTALKILNKIIYALVFIVYPFFVKFMLKGTKIDIVHSHFAPTGCYYSKLAKFLKAPHVVSFYGCDYESLPFMYPKWEKRYKKLFKEADLFLCEGSFGAGILKNKGCPQEKIQISRLGVNTSEVPYHKREKSPGELKLLQIALFSEKKGHIYTIKAFTQALKTCPNMSLTLVGGGSEYSSEYIKKQVFEEINGNNIQDKVKLIPGVNFEHLYEFLSNYQVFIHPSCYSETKNCEGGAPVVLLDAQATGMPVISTTHCDIPDEVIDGKTGILSPEKDINKLYQSIVSFYNMDNDSYQSFSQNARKHVEEFYDLKKNVENLRKIYNNLSRAIQF